MTGGPGRPGPGANAPPSSRAAPGVKPAGGASSGGGELTVRVVLERIFDIIENTNISSLGFTGFAGLLWAVMALLSKIERFMNEAWAVHRSRSLARKFGDYMNMLVVVTLMLAAFSATVTGRFVTGNLGHISTFFGRIELSHFWAFFVKGLPYLIVWPAFIFMYFYIPNTRVRVRSAAASGLIAGTLFQLVQVVFLHFQVLASKYRIYGIFAILLSLLFWVYVSWCIVLWGAEVCSAHQNLRDWRRRRRQWWGTPLERETLALRMSALLATPLLAGTAEGARRLDPGDLADLLMLPPGPVGEMIELFQANNLVVQSADDGSYLFARAPDTVSVLDILRLVRQGNLRGDGAESGFLEPLVEEISEPLRRQTVRDLAELPLDKIKSFTF